MLNPFFKKLEKIMPQFSQFVLLFNIGGLILATITWDVGQMAISTFTTICAATIYAYYHQEK